MWNLSRFFACALIPLVLGCGEDGRTRPDTVNVSGTIYFDGKPLPDADVNFVSEDGNFAAYGKTDTEGKYTLAQGAVPGLNKIFISKIEGVEMEFNPEEGIDMGQIEAQAVDTPNGGVINLPSGPKQIIPEEYSNPEKTKLSYEVPPDGTDSADFRLQ